MTTSTERAVPTRTPGPHPGVQPWEWYTSPAVLEVERRRLLDRSWALVATTEEVQAPGRYVTATIGSSPLVVVRGRHGELRAFHNLCRHRGVPLVEGAGSCGRFLTCPYHQWSFELDGTLRRVPQAAEQFAGMDPADWGLHPAAVATWHGMVLANPDPAAEPLPAALGILGPRLESFLSGPLTEVACVEYEAACNWKLLVENHIDVYHLWYVHSRSLAMYDHRVFRWELDGANWWSEEPLKEGAAPPPAALPWLERGDRHSIGAHLLFPNLMLVTTGQYFATYDAVPLAPDRTRLTLRVRAEAGADGDALVAGVRSFLAEDVAVCERLQQGAGSTRFVLGPLSATHEAPVRAFHASVARACHG